MVIFFLFLRQKTSNWFPNNINGTKLEQYRHVYLNPYTPPHLEAREISAKRTFIYVDHVIFAFGVVCSNSSREIERSLLNPCKMFYSSDFSPTSSECESEISLVNELVEFDSCSNSVELLATEEETSSRMQREFVLKRLNKGAVSAPIFSRASSE